MMKLSKKWWRFLGVLFLFLSSVELVNSDWEEVVPQESTTKEIDSGNITPNQLEGLKTVSAQELLQRKDVLNLLKNQFEILGKYGETKNGLIVQKEADWERFGKNSSLSGGTLKQVYDLWYKEKTTNKDAFLQTELPNIDEFFEQEFSTTEEAILKNGNSVNWQKLAEKKGLPAFAVTILIAMYAIWWRRKKYENNDFAGFKSIYETVAKKFPLNWGNYYQECYWETERRKNKLLLDLDTLLAEKKITLEKYKKQKKEIFTKFSKWNVQAINFIRNKTEVERESSQTKNLAQQLTTKISNYIYFRKNKQKIEFNQSLEKITQNLASEEFGALLQGDLKSLNTSQNSDFQTEFLEKIDYVTPVTTLFPMKFAPSSPSQEELESNTKDFNLLFPELSKNQIDADKYDKEVKYYENRLKNKFKNTHYWRKIWIAKLKIARANFKKAQRALEFSQARISPLQDAIKADYEAYSQNIFRNYESQIAGLTQSHKDRITVSEKKWQSFSRSRRISERNWATENIQNETKISEKQLNNELNSLKKAGGFILQMKKTADCDQQIRTNFNNSQKQKRKEYEQKRLNNPAKENVINYLENLAELNTKTYFSNQQKNLLNAQEIQVEIKRLSEKSNETSIYVTEIKKLQQANSVSNQYSFSEYLDNNSNLRKRYATPVGWLIKDMWIKNKQKIGRNGDYWQQKHARYSQMLIKNRTEYNPQIIKELEKYARKAHQEMLNSYDGWEDYFRIHPLKSNVQQEVLNKKINQLNAAESERKRLLSEQIEVLGKETKTLLQGSFDTARWLSGNESERNKSNVTNQILVTEIENEFGISQNLIESQNLINHFSEVRINQDKLNNEIANKKIIEPNDPFAFSFEKMIAPALKSMKYYSTPEGRKKRESREANLSHMTISNESRISNKNPIVYERNENGTYTAFSRETGEKITTESGIISQTTTLLTSQKTKKAVNSQNLIQQVSAIIKDDSEIKTAEISITFPEISRTAAMTATVLETAEKIILQKKENILKLGAQAQLETLLKNMSQAERNDFNIQQIKAALMSGAKILFIARPTKFPVGIHTFIRIEPNNPNARAFTLGGYNSDSRILSMFKNKLVKGINDLSDIKIMKKDTVFWQEISSPEDFDNKTKIKNILKSFFEYEDDREYYSAGQRFDFYSANCNNFSTGLLQSAGISYKEIAEWDKEILRQGADLGFAKPLEEMEPNFFFSTQITAPAQ